MPIILLETNITAPVERVFDLARNIDAHTSTTAGTGERAVDGRTSGLIEAGETVTWEAKHLGVRQRLTSKITAMERPDFLWMKCNKARSPRCGTGTNSSLMATAR